MEKKIVESIADQCVPYIEMIGNGKSLNEVLCKIYLDGFEHRTEREAQIITEAIIDSVSEFDRNFDEVCGKRDALDEMLKKFADESDAGKSVSQRCEYWAKMKTVAEQVAKNVSNGGVDIDEARKAINAAFVPSDHVSEKEAVELRRQALEAIKNSRILFGTLGEYTNTLVEFKQEEEKDPGKTAERLISLSNESIDLRALAAMICYINVKNGIEGFKDMPSNMTAAQVTIAVCAELEQFKLIERVRSNDIAVEVATEILELLGTLLLIMLAVAGFNAVTLIAFTYLQPVLAVTACILISFGIIWALSKAIVSWSDNSSKVAGKLVDFARRAVVVGATFLEAACKLIQTCAGRISEAVASKLEDNIDSHNTAEDAGTQQTEQIESTPAPSVAVPPAVTVNG